MLARTTISTLAAGAAALALTDWTGGIGSPRASRSADNSPGAIAVDAELVIAVDVSNSMDPEEQALQREGYITGLTSREFLSALHDGINGRIAITYFEIRRSSYRGGCSTGPIRPMPSQRRSLRHRTAARLAPQSTGRWNSPSRCSTQAAIKACVASSTCPVMAPTISVHR
jgi:Protein of unknown function (DUF1194)